MLPLQPHSTLVSEAGLMAQLVSPGRVSMLMLARQKIGTDKVEIVVPSVSVLAEPSVTVVDKVVLKRGTREVATEYLKYLYSKEGQEIVAKNFYRPRDPEIAAKYASQFPKLNLVTIQDLGGWERVQQVHFGRGGVFERITTRS